MFYEEINTAWMGLQQVGLDQAAANPLGALFVGAALIALAIKWLS